MYQVIGISNAPYGLTPIVEHIGFSLELPLKVEIDDDGALFLMKNNAHIHFRRLLCNGTRINVFNVQYREVHWVVNSNGYVSRPETGLSLHGDICRGDGRLVHDFVKPLMAA